jgi:hypothetical protein
MNDNKQRPRWFERFPDLFAKQTEILKASGFALDERIVQEQGRIQFDGYSKVDPGRQLIVAFPEAFPSSAPKINDTPATKLLSRHYRIDTRQLCLFGFNEKRWSANRSVADALVEAEELISKFKVGNATRENEPPEPLTRAIVYVPGAAILVPPPISTFTGFAELKPTTGKFRGKFLHGEKKKVQTSGRGIILEAEFGDEKRNCCHPFSDYFKNNGEEIRGDWFYLQDPPSQESLPEVLKQCFHRARAFKKGDFFWIALIFKEETGAGGQSRLTWLTARANDRGQFHTIRTFPYIQQERYVRIPGLEGLEEKRVVLVGCGSLGSKIAADLAASGLNRFRLVDDDYFEPNNSVRHELGVDSFGLNKEYALLHRLISLNPAVAENSKCFNFHVGGINPFANEQLFYDLVKDSDLVIDTTGVHSVSRFLNELSFEFRIRLLTAWVTNGAWSGEIVGVVPGKTPCYLCWLDQHYENAPGFSAGLGRGTFCSWV